MWLTPNLNCYRFSIIVLSSINPSLFFSSCIIHYSSIVNLQMQFLFIYIVPAYNNSCFQGALHCKVKTLQWACHWRVTILYSSSSTCFKLFISLHYYMARSMVHWYSASRFQVENKHKHCFFLQLWLYCICFIKSEQIIYWNIQGNREVLNFQSPAPNCVIKYSDQLCISIRVS